MAYNTGNAELDSFLTYVEKNFGIGNAGNAARFAADITSGKRTLEQVRSDIIHYQVGVAGIEEWVREQYGDNLSAGISGETPAERVTRIATQLLNQERTFHDTQLAIQKQTGAGGTGTDADPRTLPGVLAGGKTISLRASDGTLRVYQVYEFPKGSGQYVSYQYSGVPQAEATLGKNFAHEVWTEKLFNDRVLAQAQAEEVVGLKGSWAGLTNEIMRDAAAQAGIRDDSLVGIIASNAEMQQIMAQAIIGDWTPAQILAEQRKTKFWQDTLYPGIKRFYGKTIAPERAWLDYTANVEGGLIALGYQRDADGTYNTQIKKMLDKGLDDQIFLSQVPIFQLAQQNVKYAAVLNQWTQRDLGKTIDFNDFFSLIAGESMPELQQVAERATVAYQAQQAKAGITEAQVIRLAAETDMSEAQATALFGEFNRALLALGEPGLRRGNLSRDEILSAAAGIAPESGRSIEEVRLLAAKLAQENDLFDEEKINFYVGYTATGTPVRPGLAPLAPEAA